MIQTKRYIINITFLFIGVLSGWLLRPSEDRGQPFITYVKGNTVTDTIEIYNDTTIIVTERIPRPDRLVYVTSDVPVSREDTIKALEATADDWRIERTYKGTAVDNDTTGQFDYEAIVQYNKLQRVITSVTPVHRTDMLHKVNENKPQIFISGDVSTNNYFSVGGGIKINRIGYSLKFLKEVNGKDKGISLGLILFI